MFPSQMLTGQHVCKFQENNFEYHMKSMILNMLWKYSIACVCVCFFSNQLCDGAKGAIVHKKS